MQLLKGKTALITGASKGIGRATAVILAREGANTVLGSTTDSLLEAAGREIVKLGAPCMVRPCDVSQRTNCEELVREAVKTFGKIDILINNAGIGYSGSIVDSDPKEIERMIGVNFLGVYYMTRAVLPHMIRRQMGSIVNIGSVAGLKYSPGLAVYSATKFAVRGFTEALRNEVQSDNIRVTLVHPGMTRTAFFDTFSQGGSPLPADNAELLQPEAIAETILFALTRPSGVGLNELTVRPNWQER